MTSLQQLVNKGRLEAKGQVIRKRVKGDRKSGRRREYFSIHWTAEDVQDASNLPFRESVIFCRLREGLIESGLPRDVALLCISFLMPEARRLERCYLFSLGCVVGEDDEEVAIQSELDAKAPEAPSTGTFTLTTTLGYWPNYTPTQLPQSSLYVYTPVGPEPGVPWWGAH